jgi:hypothetical protein
MALDQVGGARAGDQARPFAPEPEEASEGDESRKRVPLDLDPESARAFGEGRPLNRTRMET